MYTNESPLRVFPLRKLNHGMSKRRGERYHVNISKTKRYKDSAVLYLQGLLIEDILENKTKYFKLRLTDEISLESLQT